MVTSGSGPVARSSARHAELRTRLPALTLRDERRLRRRLDRARSDEARVRVAADIEEAERRVETRRTRVPAITYPAELPIAARVDDLAAALHENQVVVVAGETGSGKTTQLPKLCLQLGRGVRGHIGHTQPRRIAARTVAERIATELDTDVGDVVGYRTRFDQRGGDHTLVTVMTDGILLAAIQTDPGLRAYDTIIVDEAHERSLNIDFLLGYLVRLLPRRPELKVIITSATIDPLRFATHFDDAPVIEVSGRTYPVETRYRPLDDGDGEQDQITGICNAVTELVTEPVGAGPRDILVFCSGEREIRDTADALAELDLPDTELLPLYSRLATAQQRKVFQSHRGRRIVLATNVAETSVTVPGIRFVVDPGTARISRYSARLKVQRLPIEKISQASADQRAGRCGRLAPGVCIRLFSEEDHLTRSRFTDPEILRTNLASVLLQMAALGLGDVEDFPFLDPPDRRQVRDGLSLLHELGALSDQPRSGRGGERTPVRLTDVGRSLARLPIDPRLGRMIVEADREGCLDEVLVIAAVLSIPDPRSRPPDAQQAADASHARFAHEGSDFLTLLNLWRYLREQQRARSSSAFRRMCHAEHLHHLRVREWQDLHGQLRRVALDLGLRRTDSETEPAAVHRALLTGLLGHVGMRDGEKRQYRGARDARFAIQPGSVLFKAGPQWVMAAELVETTRLWARTAARIEPAWVERLAGHLVTRTHSEAHWSAKRGGAVASERVTLYGLPLVAGRTVDYGRIDPGHARELFVRHALVEGQWHTHHGFWQRNRDRLAEAAELGEKLRRPVVVDDDALHAFYDARVPDHVVSVRHFDRWWKDPGRTDPHLLDLPDALLYGDADVSGSAFPERWRQGDLTLDLTYRFDPGSEDDGLTVHVPLHVLDRVRPEGFEWLVPGLRGELVTELLRGLPKDLRRSLVPLPQTAAQVRARLNPTAGPLLAQLEQAVRHETGVDVPRTAWGTDRLPAHLRATFVAGDADGRSVDRDDDLTALQQRLAPTVRRVVRTIFADLERTGLRTFDVDELPQVVRRVVAGAKVRGHPTLVDEGDHVDLRVVAGEAEQRRALWGGIRRLLRLGAGAPLARVNDRLDTATKLALSTNPHGDVRALLDDAVTCALDDLLLAHGGLVWTREEYERLARAVHADLVARTTQLLGVTAQILGSAGRVAERLDALGQAELQPAVTDLRAQLRGLVHPGFLTAKSARRLPDVVRYVGAMERRLDVLPRVVERDRRRMAVIHELQREYAELPAATRNAGGALEVPWMIEELRVGEFAQELGTAYRISPERVRRALQELVR